MRLASVHTYPVKSCHRVDADRVAVEPWGLAGDRRWMVAELDGTPMTQRRYPALARIRPTYQPGAPLVLRATGWEDLTVPEPVAGERLTTPMWGGPSPVPARAGGDEADEWLSEFLGQWARLMWLEDPLRRRVGPDAGPPDMPVSFADGYPLLLTNTASLDELNRWMGESGSAEGPLPMTRFRPNVVVSGAGAWAEDGWIARRLRIGPATFQVVKPCERCVVTVTDQETGERGSEPLLTLARHRKIDQRLIFGVNLAPDPAAAPVTAGDPVTVLDR